MQKVADFDSLEEIDTNIFELEDDLHIVPNEEDCECGPADISHNGLYERDEEGYYELRGECRCGNLIVQLFRETTLA